MDQLDRLPGAIGHCGSRLSPAPRGIVERFEESGIGIDCTDLDRRGRGKAFEEGKNQEGQNFQHSPLLGLRCAAAKRPGKRPLRKPKFVL